MTEQPRLRPEVNPVIWGFYGAFVAAGALVISVLLQIPMTSPSPIAGGFFTGWLAGNLWNWAGRRR